MTIKKKFNEDSRILSIRVPASQFNSIKYTIDHYIASAFKGKKDTMIPLQTGFMSFGNIIKTIQKILRKEHRINKREFDEIVKKQDIKLLNELIEIYIGKIEYSQTSFEKKYHEEMRKRMLPFIPLELQF